MARGATRTLKLTYVGDAQSLLKTNKKAESGLSSLGSKFTKFGKVAALGAAAAGVAVAAFAVKFGKVAVNAASDLDESINAVNVTFGEAAKGVQELAEASATAVGLSQSEFNSFAVQFAGFTRQIATADRDIVGVTDDLTKRIADFASVMNLDVNEAAQVFQSTLAGSSEVARKYGIDVSAAAVEQFALENGLAATKGEIDENIKVQARYGLIMQETAQFAGDFENTSDSLANSQRILKARFQDVQAQIGRRLTPVIADLMTFVSEKGIPFLEKWGGIIADKLSPYISQFIQIVREQVIPRLVEFAGKVQDLLVRFREWWKDVGPGVIASFKRLIDPIKTLFNRIKDLWNAVKDLFGAFRSGESDGGGFNTFVSVLTGVINIAINALTRMVGWITKLLGALKTLVESKPFQLALDGLSAIGGFIGRLFGGGDEPAAAPASPIVPRGTTGARTPYNVTINTGIGDPAAIARDVERVMRNENARAGAPIPVLASAL